MLEGMGSAEALELSPLPPNLDRNTLHCHQDTDSGDCDYIESFPISLLFLDKHFRLLKINQKKKRKENMPAGW